MNKKYSAERPQMIVNTAPRITLNYGVYEVSEEEMQALWDERRGEMSDMPDTPDKWFREEHRWGYNELFIPMGQWTYGGVINAIISDAYRPDVMEATINNYLLDPTDEENAKYFAEMQAWRRYAKDIAKQVVKS